MDYQKNAYIYCRSTGNQIMTFLIKNLHIYRQRVSVKVYLCVCICINVYIFMYMCMRI